MDKPFKYIENGINYLNTFKGYKFQDTIEDEKNELIHHLTNMNKVELLQFANDNKITNVAKYNRRQVILKRIILSLDDA